MLSRRLLKNMFFVRDEERRDQELEAMEAQWRAAEMAEMQVEDAHSHIKRFVDGLCVDSMRRTTTAHQPSALTPANYAYKSHVHDTLYSSWD